VERLDRIVFPFNPLIAAGISHFHLISAQPEVKYLADQFRSAPSAPRLQDLDADALGAGPGK
jgi:hypothetical protein